MSLRPDDPRPAPSAAGKPTLEDLLRLKRSERPDEAFWNEFDRGLRQKQLAAIIEPRPWWLGLSILSRRLAPYGLPVSAAAAALLAVMVVRTESPLGQSAGVVEFAPRVTPTAAVQKPAADSAPAAPLAAITPVAPAAEPVLLVETTPAPAATALLLAESAPVVPDLEPAASLEPSSAAGRSPSETIIAQNLAAVPVEAPELAAYVAPELPASAPQNESAAGADGEAESLKMVAFTPRHARVLLAMADNPDVQATGGIAHLRDRLAHSLDRDESIYGSVSRLGVGGDRLSVSF